MTYRVELSSEADLDLREIYEYIAFDLQAPGNAIELLYRLEKAILSLDKMPYRFRKYEDEKWAACGRCEISTQKNPKCRRLGHIGLCRKGARQQDSA